MPALPLGVPVLLSTRPMKADHRVRAVRGDTVKRKPLRLKSAWLVTWTGSHQRERPPVAILDRRKSTRTVREFVEQLYAILTYTPEEKLRWTKAPRDNPYRAEASGFGRITCGHNPFLFARLVSELQMEGDTLKWTEPPPESELRQQLKDAGILR